MWWFGSIYLQNMQFYAMKKYKIVVMQQDGSEKIVKME
jgi:hypothetical protein